MAPIKKRTSIRARAAATKPTASAPSNPTTPANPSAIDLPSLKLKKQDKRHLKHTALMHKVRDASISKTSEKRRRPGKKLQAAESLGGLRDALPVDDEEEGEWEGLSEDEGGEGKVKGRSVVGGEGKIKMRSLKHRPGAMKRKAGLERREQERFARNLAQLASNEGSGKGNTRDGGGQNKGEGGQDGQANKWAALRTFIGGTLEQDPAFGKS